MHFANLNIRNTTDRFVFIAARLVIVFSGFF